MGGVIIGREAVAAGIVTRHELARWYTPLFPGVYSPKGKEPSLRDRTVAAWLWSKRRAVVAGVAASALHGAPWVDADVPIELVWSNGRAPRGLTARNDTLCAGETTRVAGIPVTTPARTAFDLARHLPRDAAVARLDALMWATPFAVPEVVGMVARHKGVRGLARLGQTLRLVDGGAASPKETWLRLLLIDHGYPAPTTQILVLDGTRLVAAIDMGWEHLRIGVEYDGDHHRSNRGQYVKDQRRLRSLESRGWIVIRVIAEDRPGDIVARVAQAWRRRGARPAA